MSESLIAISIESIQKAPYIGSDGRFAKTATVRGVSKQQDMCFTITTNLLSPEQIRVFELLARHGSTVVEVPKNWEYGYNGPGGWQEVVIQQAMDRIAKLYEGKEGIEPISAYDPELAEAILARLNESFPFPMSDHELKRALIPEPSNDALFTALEGLEIDGLVDGDGLIGNTSGRCSLVSMANIKINGEGRRHLQDDMRRKTARSSKQALHISDASASILMQLLAEFRERHLTHDDLRSTYQGLPPVELNRASVAEGISEVDFDLSMSDLESHDLVKTGPMVLIDSPPGMVVIGFRSKHEYSYLTVDGYREATKLESTPPTTLRSSGPLQAVIHGDQIINYGHAAAIGRQSHGQINYQGGWSEQQLHSLADELEQLRLEYRKVAISREDDRQLALLADAADEAEKGNGHGVAAVLANVGKKALEIAQSIGTDVAAKAIAEVIKG